MDHFSVSSAQRRLTARAAVRASGLLAVLVASGFFTLAAGEQALRVRDGERPSIEERLAHVNSHPKMVERLDSNGDGVVDEAELRAAHEARVARFDTDGDGKLSKEERAAARAAHLEELRQRLTEAKANGKSEKFDRVDQNGDGELSDEELKAAIRHHRKNCEDKQGGEKAARKARATN